MKLRNGTYHSVSMKMPRIKNKRNKVVQNDWVDELQKTLRTTLDLLDELDGIGHPGKQITEVKFIERDTPVWIGICADAGRIELDPYKHDARAVAHEAGHGFHERWREDNGEPHGEEMAEAIRFFVEERMGDSHWECPVERRSVLDRCGYSFEQFKELLLSGALRNL